MFIFPYSLKNASRNSTKDFSRDAWGYFSRILRTKFFTASSSNFNREFSHKLPRYYLRNSHNFDMLLFHQFLQFVQKFLQENLQRFIPSFFFLNSLTLIDSVILPAMYFGRDFFINRAVYSVLIDTFSVMITVWKGTVMSNSTFRDSYATFPLVLREFLCELLEEMLQEFFLFF